MALANIAILRAENSSQYVLSSQTGARSARHSLKPQTIVASKYRKLPSMMGLRHRLILGSNVIDEQFYYISDTASVILKL